MIGKNLAFSTPLERIQDTVWKHILDRPERDYILGLLWERRMVYHDWTRGCAGSWQACTVPVSIMDGAISWIFYILNLLEITVDMVLYFRNTRLDRENYSAYS